MSLEDSVKPQERDTEESKSEITLPLEEIKEESVTTGISFMSKTP